MRLYLGIRAFTMYREYRISSLHSRNLSFGWNQSISQTLLTNILIFYQLNNVLSTTPSKMVRWDYTWASEPSPCTRPTEYHHFGSEISVSDGIRAFLRHSEVTFWFSNNLIMFCPLLHQKWFDEIIPGHDSLHHVQGIQNIITSFPKFQFWMELEHFLDTMQ